MSFPARAARVAEGVSARGAFSPERGIRHLAARAPRRIGAAVVHIAIAIGIFVSASWFLRDAL